MMHLSTDDVRQFLQRYISAHGLTRLQIGDVTETDDETITADIVTARDRWRCAWRSMRTPGSLRA